MLQFHLMHKDTFKQHKEEVRGEEGGRPERREEEETMGKGREIRQIVKQRIRVIISNEAKDDGGGGAETKWQEKKSRL